jgi:ArsR family transcriptional regulator
MAKLDATQSRMSRHMRILRQAGLVIDRRDAQWVRYRLNPALHSEVRAVLDAVLDIASGENGRDAEGLAA